MNFSKHTLAVALTSLFFGFSVYADSIELVRDPSFDNGYTVGMHNTDELLHPNLD